MRFGSSRQKRYRCARPVPARSSSEDAVSEFPSREVFERSREASGLGGLEAQDKNVIGARDLSPRGLRA
ncbi:MAG: hypothetical protein RL156_391, partial [Bacteroidota bacterium]